MKRNITLGLFLVFYFSGFTQSTGLRVYQIFQDKCATCHSNADPQSGLDLEGSGTTEIERAAAVYQNIVGVSPDNAFAAAQGYSQVYPGRPDRSFIFRKINEGLEETIRLDTEEKQNMPPNGQEDLTDVEKELIRQWILFGAPPQGEVVEEELLEDYYNKNGIQSFPDGAPDAPDVAEGFQIKMGPFYLKPSGEPGDELEYFQKYEVDLPEDLEVNRIDIKIAGSSHHFILYNFPSQFGANQIPPGLRLNSNHSDISLIAAVQEKTDLRLPEGTAFFWDKKMNFDLNSHYINYSVGNTFQAEAYINVYTQPKGTAVQEMKTELYANTSIFIDNDENLVTESAVDGQFTGGQDQEIYLWGIMGHTHKYGKSYKAWTRENGEKKDLIYDAGCAEGVPDCAFSSFDYQHIPMRYFEPLMPLSTVGSSSIYHEASWLNDGDKPVGFGPTSDDEMMVLILMYLQDTTGLYVSTNTEEVAFSKQSEVKVFPNPMFDQTTFEFSPDLGKVDLSIYNILGGELFRETNITESTYQLDRGLLNAGMYVYQIRGKDGIVRSGKLMVKD